MTIKECIESYKYYGYPVTYDPDLKAIIHTYTCSHCGKDNPQKIFNDGSKDGNPLYCLSCITNLKLLSKEYSNEK